MKAIVIADSERPQITVPIALAYGVGLECTTFYDPNYLEEHPDGIAVYLRLAGPVPFKTMHGPFTGLSTGVRDKLIRDVTMLRYRQACETAQRLSVCGISSSITTTTTTALRPMCGWPIPRTFSVH